MHEIYAEWRQVFNEYDPPRTAVAEAWVHASRRARYASPQGLGQAFNFDLLQADFDADEFRRDHHPQPGRGRGSPGPRPPGCSPTTTSSGTPPATACRRAPTASTQDGHGLAAQHGTAAGARRRARPAPGPRRDPADAGAAGLRLPVPGRGARPARGRRPPGRRAQDPAFFRDRAASRRAATAAACRCRGRVDGPVVRLRRRTARTCRSRPGSAPHSVAGAGRRPGSTLQLYRRALDLRRELQAGEELEWVDDRTTRCCTSAGRAAGSRSRTSAPSRFRCRRGWC